MNDHYYDITEVCNLLNITSRTLRFYEEKGIIQSTTFYPSKRRKYSSIQLDTIKNVLVLRKIGLSVKDISSFQSTKYDLKSMISLKKIDVYARIEKLVKEINMLNDAILTIESGNDIFSDDASDAEATDKICWSIEEYTRCIINGDTKKLYNYFSDKLKEYIPYNVYERVRSDVFSVLGEFVTIEKIEKDRRLKNKYCHYVKYSKYGLKITYSIRDGLIHGLWLGYYEALNGGTK